jgi:hypothetical protein
MLAKDEGINCMGVDLKTSSDMGVAPRSGAVLEIDELAELTPAD